MRSNDNVVCELDVPPGFLAPLTQQPNVSLASLDEAATSVEGRVVLVVTLATKQHLEAVRRSFPVTPVLGVLPDLAAATNAVSFGADYVLAKESPGPLVLAVYTAAVREVARRLHAQATFAALESVSESVEIASPDGTVISVNRAFEKMTGYERSDIEGTNPVHLLRSDIHDPRFFGEMWSTVTSKRRWTGGLIGRRRDGALITQLAVVKPIVDDRNDLRHIVSVKTFVPSAETLAARNAADVTAHVHASITALTNSERRYRRMLEAASDAIVVVDFETSRIVEANPAATKMFGYSHKELLDLSPPKLAGPGAEDVVERVFHALHAEGRALEHRHPMTRKDGTRFWATVQLTAYEFMGRRQYMSVIRDVTGEVERQHALEQSNQKLAETQTQLLHSSRLAALGQMAAGVAHEINNPLQYILAGIEEVDILLDRDASTREVIGDMREGAERIRAVTRSLLPFARVDHAQLEAVDLVEVVEWAARVTANEIRHRARLDLRLGHVPPIPGQRVRIGQLVTNLLTNAAHAITEGASERHRISVTTSVFEGRVRLVVEDTGAGIPEEIRPRIFDPFFTTKAREVGTGLGLALCAEIVTRQGGTIEFESTLGMGSRFVVTFGHAPQEPSPQSTRTGRRPSLRVGHMARVLLIDDEEPIVRTYKRFLKGMDVVTAVGGKAALAILAEDLDFDVILCDLMMPSVDGLMIYEHLSTVAPELAAHIVFCSGGAFTSRVREFLERVPNVILDKPVSPAHLRATLEATVKRP